MFASRCGGAKKSRTHGEDTIFGAQPRAHGPGDSVLKKYFQYHFASLPEYLTNITLVLGMATLAGCATTSLAPNTSPTAVSPDLIPVRDFVANCNSNFGYQISPDGRKLAWVGVLGVSMHIFVKDLERDFTHTLPVGYLYTGFTWAQDSRHLLFNFHEGDENQLVLRLDTASGEEIPRFQAVVAEKGVSAVLVSQPADDPDHILVAHNRRDKTIFDLYRVHLLSGRQTLVTENPGNVKAWLTDPRGRPAGRIVKQDENIALQLNEAAAPIYTWSAADSVGFAGLSERGDRLFLLSNKGRDRVALLEIDIASGAEKVLHAHPQVDVTGVMVHPISGEPLTAYAQPDYPEVTRLNAAAPDFSNLKQGPGHRAVISSDRAFRRLVVAHTTDKGEAYFLYDKASGQATQIGASPSLSFKSSLADVRPVSFTSRDHIPLHGYLTLPVNAPSKPHPMVLLVHGGPWERDGWRYDPEVQFLANRGYAVLQVNYRGSSGYGRRFRELAVGEFAGKMQDDLIDAVRWAIAQGYADPDRIAISGGSYGGYAALVGLTATPDTFACGIDQAGPTDLVRLVEDFPQTWKLEMDMWHRYAGDPAKASDREILRAKSPLFQTERIVRPLMVVQGGRDARVRPHQSIELVQRLRQQNKPVDFWLIPAEGHAVVHWPHQFKLFRKTENFLANCLGGRSGGFDYYQSGAWLF
jgi:dipeptidyl aminopeptidase/acylaminoacyl peptidase